MREGGIILPSPLPPTSNRVKWYNVNDGWQRIHVGMDEMYEMDQTYLKFYTQLAKELIVFTLLC